MPFGNNGGDHFMECGGTGVFDHDAALDGEAVVHGKTVSPLLRRSAAALHRNTRSNVFSIRKPGVSQKKFRTALGRAGAFSTRGLESANGKRG
jgi:hypothetical protein